MCVTSPVPAGVATWNATTRHTTIHANSLVLVSSMEMHNEMM